VGSSCRDWATDNRTAGESLALQLGSSRRHMRHGWVVGGAGARRCRMPPGSLPSTSTT